MGTGEAANRSVRERSRVLLVDDEGELTCGFERSMQGCVVHRARTLQAAVRAAERHCFDAVIAKEMLWPQHPDLRASGLDVLDAVAQRSAGVCRLLLAGSPSGQEGDLPERLVTSRHDDVAVAFDGVDPGAIEAYVRAHSERRVSGVQRVAHGGTSGVDVETAKYLLVEELYRRIPELTWTEREAIHERMRGHGWGALPSRLGLTSGGSGFAKLRSRIKRKTGLGFDQLVLLLMRELPFVVLRGWRGGGHAACAGALEHAGLDVERLDEPKPLVLVVEDNRHAWSAVRRAFAPRFRVELCRWETEAHELLAAVRSWDAVVADLELGPDGSGARVVRRAREQNPSCAALVVSQHEDPDLLRRMSDELLATRGSPPPEPLPKAMGWEELAAYAQRQLERAMQDGREERRLYVGRDDEAYVESQLRQQIERAAPSDAARALLQSRARGVRRTELRRRRRISASRIEAVQREIGSGRHSLEDAALTVLDRVAQQIASELSARASGRP